MIEKFSLQAAMESPIQSGRSGAKLLKEPFTGTALKSLY